MFLFLNPLFIGVIIAIAIMIATEATIRNEHQRSSLKIFGPEDYVQWKLVPNRFFGAVVKHRFHSYYDQNRKWKEIKFFTIRGALKFMDKITGDNETYYKEQEKLALKIKESEKKLKELEWQLTKLKKNPKFYPSKSKYTGSSLLLDKINEVFPNLTVIESKCPEANCSYGKDLRDLIIHLNDYHKWTLDKIANWLEESDHNPTAIKKEKA